MSTLNPLKFYLAIQPEETVFTATVSATPSDPYVSISYNSGVTGSFGLPIAGQTVFFETTSGGRERGALRLKNTPTVGNGTLEVAESDDVGPLIQSGDKVRIINQFRLWPRYPRFTQNGTQVTIQEDFDIDYSNQTNEWRPKAVTPPVGFAFLEAGQAQVKFTSVDQQNNGTRAMAPGASISSYLWTARGSLEGTSTGQGTVASPVTFTWDSPGWFLVSLQVTDSNGNTDTQYTYVLIDDRDNPQYVFAEFDVTSDNFDYPQGGGECSFVVHNSGGIADFPQEGLVVLIADGDITTPTASWPYRTNILFSGWILSNTIRQNPETGDVSFRAGTIDAIMRNLTMFPVSLTNKTTPRNWTQAKSLTVDRAAYFVYKYRSTLALMTPIVFSGYTSLIQRQDFGNNLHNAIQGELMRSILGNVVSTHQSVLYHVIDYNVQLTAERANATTRKTLHKGIWANDVFIDEKQDYSQPVNQIQMSGVHYPGGDVEDICPLFSEAPGDAPKVYGSPATFDRLILAGQTSLNIRCGLMLGKLTERYGPYRMQFLNDGSFGVVPQDLFPTVIEANDNERALSYSGNLIARRISRQYDHANGYFSVNVDFEPETTGPPGVTVDLPCGPPEQILPPTLLPDPPAGIPGATSLIAGTTGTSFYFEPGIGQTWQRRVSGLVDPDQLGFLDVLPDPWSDFKQGYNPENVIIWGSGRGFLVRSTDSGKNWADRSSFLEEDAPNGNLDQINLIRIQCDIFREDKIYVLGHWQVTGTHQGAIAVSDDGFNFDWHTISGTVRPLGMSLDRANGNTLFVTTWESSPTGTICLKRYDTNDMSLSAQYNLGQVSADDIDANLYYATPFTCNGQNCEVWIYGRMNNPQGFTGTVHVLKNTNCGATGSYSVVENTWQESLAGSFGADDDGYLYAVRNGQVSASTISISSSPEDIVSSEGEFGVDNGLTTLRATIANDDIVAIIYEDQVGGEPIKSNYILYNRQTDTPGTASQLNDDNPHDVYASIGLVLERIENNRILTFHNNDANSGGYGRVVTNSDVTPSLQPDTRYHESTNAVTEHVSVDGVVAGKHSTLATGVLAYRIGEDADFGYFQTWTVASGNVSFGTAVQMEIDNPALLPLDLKYWTGNKYLFAFRGNGLSVKVLDTTTGINEGDTETEPTSVNVSFARLIKIDESRMLCFYFDNDDNKFYCVVATLFASDQIIWGTPLELGSSSDTLPEGTNIIDRGNDIFTVGYPHTSTAWTVESVSVSGSTVVKLNDTGTRTLGDVLSVHLVGFSSDDGAMVYIDEGTETIQYRAITGLPEIGNAVFYHGLNSLTQKFTLPWTGVLPQAMTLDKSLGTIVMGSKEPSTDPVIYSVHPYTTGTSTSLGFPTGTSTRVLKWI